MNAGLLLIALYIWVAGALICLLLAHVRRVATVVGVGAAVMGALPAIYAALSTLVDNHGGAWQAELPWAMPFGRLLFAMDLLSAIFVAVTALITALAAIYGVGYLRQAKADRPTGLSWCLFNLLTASMVSVFLAANAIFFLLAWEMMALTSFGLVMYDHDRHEVRRAGLVYFIATHLGTALLLVMFLVFGHEARSFDFASFQRAALSPGMAGFLFVLAVIGFGTKAGFMPMHVWLPEAHPAAPSHVSAVMSGVMIKTGIYGILRMLWLLHNPVPWWGWTLLVIGAVSGVTGILLALAQRDLKRLLAYSSVENIGVIALGLGLGLLGLSYGLPAVAFLGFAGGLLHVINHAIYKSLLFMGAGSVLHATGTREIEHLGGLLKRMPSTGLGFLTGSAAICGLPPLNGFVSEFLIGLGAFVALTSFHSFPCGIPAAFAGAVVLVSLALISGLAIACFTKVFGIIFLGEPRSEHAMHAHESDLSMRLPMVVLAAACAAIGFAGPLIVMIFAPSGVTAIFVSAATAMLALLAVPVLALLLLWLRARLVAGRIAPDIVTWDCGYAAPGPRMQYTASSFAQPLLWLVRHLLRARRRFTPPRGLFPAQTAFASETPDVANERVYRPVFAALENLLARVQWMQHGRLNLYILSIVLALIALLIWKMG